MPPPVCATKAYKSKEGHASPFMCNQGPMKRSNLSEQKILILIMGKAKLSILSLTCATNSQKMRVTGKSLAQFLQIYFRFELFFL